MLYAEILHEEAVIQRGMVEVDGTPCVSGWVIDSSKVPDGERNAVYFHVVQRPPHQTTEGLLTISGDVTLLGEEEPA